MHQICRVVNSGGAAPTLQGSKLWSLAASNSIVKTFLKSSSLVNSGDSYIPLIVLRMYTFGAWPATLQRFKFLAPSSQDWSKLWSPVRFRNQVQIHLNPWLPNPSSKPFRKQFPKRTSEIHVRVPYRNCKKKLRLHLPKTHSSRPTCPWRLWALYVHPPTNQPQEVGPTVQFQCYKRKIQMQHTNINRKMHKYKHTHTRIYSYIYIYIYICLQCKIQKQQIYVYIYIYYI